MIYERWRTSYTRRRIGVSGGLLYHYGMSFVLGVAQVDLKQKCIVTFEFQFSLEFSSGVL